MITELTKIFRARFGNTLTFLKKLKVEIKITGEIRQQPLSLSAKTLSIINHILPDGLYFEEHVT